MPNEDNHDPEEIPQLKLRSELALLRQEHRDLDAAIEALRLSGRSDPLQLQRFKKKKLAIKDRVSNLEDTLLPDIIA